MSLAHVGRALVAAQRLRELGHRVTFATGHFHHKLALAEGFTTHQIECVDPAYALQQIRRGSHIFHGNTLKRYVESDRNLIQATAPDVILADMRLSLNLSAELEAIEHQHLVNAYLTRYSAFRETPPRSFPLTAILRGPLEAAYPTVKGLALRAYARPFRKLRLTFNLPDTVGDIRDVICSPHFNYLVDDPDVFPSTPDIPDNYQYLGPVVWEPGLPQTLPDWWPQFEAYKGHDAVYVSMGSTGDRRKLARVLQGLVTSESFPIIATGQDACDLAIEGVWAAPLLPGSLVLPKCRLAICHGGSGTLYQCRAHGVPSRSIPTFHDQEINAERFEQLQSISKVASPGRAAVAA